jgi:hypothetical protein
MEEKYKEYEVGALRIFLELDVKKALRAFPP